MHFVIREHFRERLAADSRVLRHLNHNRRETVSPWINGPC